MQFVSHTMRTEMDKYKNNIKINASISKVFLHNASFGKDQCLNFTD